MYASGNSYEKMKIQVPDTVILQANVKVVLPVYMVMYIKDEPCYGDFIRTNTSIAELMELTGVFGTGVKRRQHYNRTIEAIRWLDHMGVIRTWDFNPLKPQAMFKYRLNENLNDVIGRGKSQTFGYAAIGLKEYLLFRDLMMQEKPDGRGADALCRIYCCVRLRYTLWQRTYIKDSEGTLPVWCGNLSAIAKELCLSTGTITNGISALQKMGVVMPCYGAIPPGGTASDKPETLLGLTLLCEGKDQNKIIYKAQERYRKKPRREHSRWYPIGMTLQKTVKKKQEEAAECSALVVMPPKDVVVEPIPVKEVMPA